LEARPHSMDALMAMSDESLSAVEGLELRVAGCGTLRWPGTTDLRGIVGSLDEIVRFRPHEVRVYDGAIPKPPTGEGLNKRCYYTMENVWARDRLTGDYLMDTKSIGAFRTQLLRKADRMGASMHGYDHQRGEWTIEVAHF